LAVSTAPRTRYAQSAEASIAYQVSGEGPIDLVTINGPASHLEVMWEEPGTARSFRKLASFSRLIQFDRRGTGLSDAVSSPPTLEQQMDDLQAVLAAVGSEALAAGILAPVRTYEAMGMRAMASVGFEPIGRVTMLVREVRGTVRQPALVPAIR